MNSLNKVLIVLTIVLILIIGVSIILLIPSNQWEKDISISGGDWVANGYQNASTVGGSMFDAYEKGNPYYEYEITNETNHRMKDVVIIFKCEKNFFTRKEKGTYKFEVGYLDPHEKKSVKVYHWDMYEGIDDSFGSTSHDIQKVTYRKG